MARAVACCCALAPAAASCVYRPPDSFTVLRCSDARALRHEVIQRQEIPEPRSKWDSLGIDRSSALRAGLSAPLRVAVLLIGQLRLPDGVKGFAKIGESSSAPKCSIFFALDDRRLDDGTVEQVCGLNDRIEMILRMSAPHGETASKMVEFTSLLSREGTVVRTLHQFFLMVRAYEMMLAFEAAAGCRFDAVFRTRTDMAPYSVNLDLIRFPELRGPVHYGIEDRACVVNRGVAAMLYPGLEERMVSYRGTDWDLLPISYKQLLDSELQDSGFQELNFPCVGAAARPQLAVGLRREVVLRYLFRNPPRRLAAFRGILQRHRSDFEAAHGTPPRPQPGTRRGQWCTGAWWHNESSYRRAVSIAVERDYDTMLQFDGHVQPEKLYFYIVNQLQPQINWRRWPGGTPLLPYYRLHPLRHHTLVKALWDDGRDGEFIPINRVWDVEKV